jgi:hypothetical protein
MRGDGFRPLREFLDEMDAQMIAEDGWLRWKLRKLRAVVTVRWPLKWYLFWHGRPRVSQKAFDAVSADRETLDAIRASQEQSREPDPSAG